LKRLSLGLLAALVILPAAAHAFPWSKDMRRTVALWPQAWARTPADSSVPRTGKVDYKLERTFSDRIANPVPRTPESEARGQHEFEKFCTPCHGLKAMGDGPVSTRFPGVANLTLPLTQGRTDGYIYFYIRHGGVLMPSYGYGVKPDRAWDVVNYVRKLQGK